MMKEAQSNEDFYNFVNENPNVLVEFFATWCPHCHAFQPVLEEASEKMDEQGVQIIQCDVDKLQELAGEFNVEATPTIFFMKNGQPVLKNEGALPQAGLFEFVEQGKEAE